MMSNSDEVKALFEAADIDKSGSLSSEEVKKILELNSGRKLPESTVQAFIRKYDLNADGQWSIEELAKLLASE
ncbi:unnamed protein product [Trichobilharzia szidati]|nr:unnamed protein product [Trichobilharzia szidati]